MGYFSKFWYSSDLVKGMASRLGVDLAEAIAADPEFETARYREAAMRCAACGHTQACRMTQNASVELAAAPAFCRNTQLFARLSGV